MKVWNKINALQFGIAVYFIMRSMSLGIAVDSYIRIGGVDGYLSPIIGTIIGFIPLMLFIKIMNYKPELTLFEKIDYLFGKNIGKIINIIITGAIYFLLTIVFWNLLNFISSQYLYRTDTLVISIVFGIALGYISIKSLNVIFRVSNMLFYISIITFIICILGLIGEPKLSNLLPFLEYGISKPFIGGLSHVAYSVLPLFILLMIPRNNIENNNKLTKYIIMFYLLASATKIFVTFIIISTFGIDLASLYEFPDFIVLRRISTTGFFQRFESILATQWIFDAFVMLSFSFAFIKNAYIHIIRKKHKDLFIIITVLITCIICSNYMFSNNTVGDNFILYKLPFILTFLFFIIPLIIFLKIKKNCHN